MRKVNSKGFSAIWLLVLVVVIGIAGVGFMVFRFSNNSKDSNNSSTTQDTSINKTDNKPAASNNNATKAATITSSSSEFGPMLFDDKKQAIYIWEVEKTTKAECYDDCADAWPPVLTNGAPIATGDVKGDLLDTTTRSDGSTQVTYNGHPLYYYADEEPGEVKCHNISTHGGLWWVIQPDGERAE